MHEGRSAKIAGFVAWCDSHITGDEKGQAQIFLDRLFQAFGQKGSLDVGGSPEMRIKKSSEDGGGTSFADYVWKPVVLIEMKKRGVDLSRHYRQAFEYWTRLVPNRPRYVVLCNFDRFDVYDFDRQIDSPVDSVALTELPERWGPLAFLFPTQEKPTFDNDREKVTREAADRLATCYRKLVTRNVEPSLRQRFILQVLVALFSEDIGLLEKYTVSHLLDTCKEPSDSYDLLGGLFEAMNREEGNPGGRYKGVRYFNGGLFVKPARLELYEDELNQLRECSKSDWSKVDPHIFGTIFQHSMEAEERHAMGAHYTSPLDIMKIVKPTIVDPWERAITAARSDKALLALLDRLGTLRVLDPACGSGNFLYMAYREMRRLESSIRERLFTEFPKTQATFAHVNAKQFFGMDIIPFAIELAKVTMMIARKLTIDELHIADEEDLPLANLDENFRRVDALVENGIQTRWEPADVVIGNPPFLGAKGLKPERGVDYINGLRKLYPDVPGMADYCVYWIRRTHDHLPQCTKSDPFIGRAGLVGTQNIRHNQSRVGGLDHVVATGTIVEAVDNQPWSGEAKVHVSIANWIKSQDAGVVPKLKRLWSKVRPPASALRGKRKSGARDNSYELSVREVASINAALSDMTDVTQAEVLRCNRNPKRVFQGITPGHDGFVLSHQQRLELVRSDPRSAEVIHPYLIGRELVRGDGTPERWVIDFEKRDAVEIRQFTAAYRHIESKVLGARRLKADAGKDASGKMRPHHKAFLERWWKLSWDRAEMIAEFRGITRYIGLTRNTTFPVYCFVSPVIRPSDVVQVFCFEDDFSFAVLQATPHRAWLNIKGSNRGTGPRYTPDSVFDTMPWPQHSTKKQIDAVAAAGREVRRVRQEALKVIDGGLRAVYRSLELPGKHPLKDAHAALDAAVLAAYGFSPKDDLLKQLLDLNKIVAAKERAGEAVTAPGVPSSYGDPSSLITDDCIRPERT